MIIAVAVGAPKEDDKRPAEERWEATIARLSELFEKERVAEEKDFTNGKGCTDRGDFGAVNFGTSLGPGQAVRSLATIHG